MRKCSVVIPARAGAGRVARCLVLLAAACLGAPGEARAQAVQETYDVELTVAPGPWRDARFVFALSNGDTQANNSALVEQAAIDGALGTSFETTGSVLGNLIEGFRIDDRPLFFSQLVQKDARLGGRFSFRLTVTEIYPFESLPNLFQPDQFSFFVLEATSNAALLSSDDPTTANALFTLDLRPGSTPRIYQPGPRHAPGAWNVAVTPVPEPSALASGLAALAALAAARRSSR
jgi:hypothetical protein